MAETMEQYMSKTRTHYGLGVAMPKIDNKYQFELKGQFLKELQENTFSGSDNEDANEHFEKFLEIVDLFHVPNITVDQLMFRVFPISLTGAEVILFYNGLDVPTRQIPYSRGVVPTKTATDAKTTIQEMVEYSQKWHKEHQEEEVGCGGYRPTAPGYYQRNNVNPSFQERRQSIEDTLSKFMSESAKGHEENSNLINKNPSFDRCCNKEPRSIDQNFRNANRANEQEEGNYGPKFTEAYGASHINNTIPRKEKDPRSFTLPCFINDLCFDNALVDLGASVSVMPLSTYLNLGLCEFAHTRLTVELADRTVKYPKGIAENVLLGIGKFTFPIYFIILDMPEDVKVPLILGIPFLSTAHAKIDVYKRKITLRVGEEKIIFKSVKPANSIIKRAYLNEPFEHRRNQGDDLMPTIEEGEVIEEFRTRDENLDTRIDDYPSYCDEDKKIHIDCAHNLKFSCMIGFEFTHANFFPLLYVNMMSRKFHNSIMKNKMVYKGNNVVGALMNVPIFVGTFSVTTDFAVLEDMDAYRDNEMGDIIFGEAFLREVGIKTKRFEGIITLYNGDNEVTYQMVRSHPKLKHHTNEQCNKIPPLLKVSEKDKINRISHAYQKLKGIYKEVLNLGPDFIRVSSMEEWLTRGHIIVDELE
ncbi:putative reverse transcriptase domain-containing protein [Tanacetum coccineum]